MIERFVAWVLSAGFRARGAAKVRLEWDARDVLVFSGWLVTPGAVPSPDDLAFAVRVIARVVAEKPRASAREVMRLAAGDLMDVQSSAFASRHWTS